MKILNKKSILLAALAVGMMAVSALADDTPQPKLYTYRVDMPATSQSCDVDAQAVATSFAKANGSDAQSVKGSCQTRQAVANAAGYQADTIIVSYMSVGQLLPVRSVFGGTEFESVASADSGLFASYGDCVNAIPNQTELYEAQTGLPVVAAYCTAAELAMNPGYSLTIESFGQAKRSLFAFFQSDVYTDDGSQADVMQAASAAVVKSGGVIAYSDSSHLFYYAHFSISIEVADLGTFSDPSECTAQQTIAQSIYTKAGLVGVVALCQPFSSDSSQATLTVVGAGPDEVTDDYGLTSNKYSSYAECNGDRSRVLENLASSGYTILGTVCEPDDVTTNVFVMHVFTHNLD